MIYREGPPDPGPMPICPECGAETLKLYINDLGFVVGCDECIEPHTVCCPECGAETLEIYKNQEGRIVGCEECIRTKDAVAWEEENREDW